ncbi:MAG TPA: hypothetical protein VD978_35185 [Azospirillum sp.]|nr:hypothetical protein [Azospirillum sp.]
MWDLLFAFAAWYLCGMAGFLYWWSEDFRVDARALTDALAFGIMGPITILCGWLIHRLTLAEEENELKPIQVRTDDECHPRR